MTWNTCFSPRNLQQTCKPNSEGISFCFHCQSQLNTKFFSVHFCLAYLHKTNIRVLLRYRVQIVCLLWVSWGSIKPMFTCVIRCCSKIFGNIKRNSTQQNGGLDINSHKHSHHWWVIMKSMLKNSPEQKSVIPPMEKNLQKSIAGVCINLRSFERNTNFPEFRLHTLT